MYVCMLILKVPSAPPAVYDFFLFGGHLIYSVADYCLVCEVFWSLCGAIKGGIYQKQCMWRVFLFVKTVSLSDLDAVWKFAPKLKVKLVDMLVGWYLCDDGNLNCVQSFIEFPPLIWLEWAAILWGVS